MMLQILKLLPKNMLSRLVGYLMAAESPRFLVNFLKTWFAGHYQIRLDEAEKDFTEYTSINALFTRKLRSGIRPILGDLVHPCDSQIAQAGTLEDGMLIQAKSWKYSAADLTGEPGLAEKLTGGFYTTYYLCPTDYHRVHSPVEGLVQKVRHIPGSLWPVNPGSVNGIRSLFIKNERVVFELETVFGPVVLVMVGATNVGKISTSIGPSWMTNTPGVLENREYVFEQPQKVSAGDELGVFHMGSTVIMLWPAAAGIKSLPLDRAVLLGQSIRAR